MGHAGFGEHDGGTGADFLADALFPELGHGAGGAVEFALFHHLGNLGAEVGEVRFAFADGSDHGDGSGFRLANHGFGDAGIFLGIELSGEAGDGGDDGISVLVLEGGDVFGGEKLVAIEDPAVV